MADNRVGELRRSAVIMTYAPGSIVDMRADGAPVSGVSAGLEEWDRSAPLAGNLKHQKIIERRLCKKLGKKYFRLPPVVDDDTTLDDGTPDPAALVLRRFPEWLQCSSCELLKPANRWAKEPGRASRYCADCTTRQPGGKRVFAIPVRFAVACIAGHLEEFPWNWWVAHKPECKNRERLKLSSIGPGLAGLIVSCPDCRQQRSLDGAFRDTALSGLACQGHRPWLRTNETGCKCQGNDGTYRVVQRGASNLYYPVIESALDIPPWTRRLEQALGDYWDDLADAVSTDDRVRLIEATPGLTRVVKELGIGARELAARFEQMRTTLDEIDPANLRLDEYRVFTTGTDERDEEFESYREGIAPDIELLVSQVVRVARLREVRVVRGFTRINAPFDAETTEISPISVGALDWLPAIEVRGEGLFVRLDGGRLHQWEALPVVAERVRQADHSWKLDWERRNPGKPRPFTASARLLMVHSFSHALIRQLTLECGYSSASLRERLYVSEGDEGMAGVLIYTATPDSDGTLGGLQRRAMQDLLGPTILAAIRSMQWCSSDPLCLAGELAAPESHSVAACHSCMLVPETSCEMHNRFLDRALLVGTESDLQVGYFSQLLQGGK